jgi:hypothetical protein
MAARPRRRQETVEVAHKTPEEAITLRERIDPRFLLGAPLGLDDAELLAMAEKSGWPVKSDEEVLAARRTQERTRAWWEARRTARREGRLSPSWQEWENAHP